jgi:drug/metabolite transporter (DMT)-like permease
MRSQTWLYIPLTIIGATWGLTVPAMKIAVDSGYPVTGVLFWQVALAMMVALLLFLPKRRAIRITRRRIALFVWIMAFGSVLPGLVSYTASGQLPAGVMAITIAMVPIFIMPIALLTGHEVFQAKRVMGVLMGAIAIFLLIGPEASLPDPSKAGFVLLALLSPLFYALEDNYIAYFGLDGLTPIETLLGSAMLGSIVMGVVVISQGTFIPIWDGGLSSADLAIIVIGVTTGVAYAGFIWIIGQAGPVFSGQIAYLVTIFGVLWSVLLIGESYSGYIWLAFAVMLFGMFLVRPRGEGS